MSEDVSATIRVGITVILVAALVATVLNLMVMANSLLQNGQTTLQSGIDAVSEQEFAPFNNTKVSGTQVNTALSLFQGRDVAILIQTTATKKCFQENGNYIPTSAYSTASANDIYINYGALLTTDNNASNGTSNLPQIWEYDGTNNPKKHYNTAQLVLATAPTQPFGINWLSTTAKSICFATAPTSSAGKGHASCYQADGDPWFTGNLHNTNGLVDSSYDTVGTTILGNGAYLLSSSRFTSVLIKDPTGSIIGIVFRQVA